MTFQPKGLLSLPLEVLSPICVDAARQVYLDAFEQARTKCLLQAHHIGSVPLVRWLYIFIKSVSHLLTSR